MLPYTEVVVYQPAERDDFLTGFWAEDPPKSGKADFYVAPNGDVLPGEYESWIGDNQRDRVVESIEDDELRKVIAEAYLEASVIGDGSLMDYISFAKTTGVAKHDYRTMIKSWYVTNHLGNILIGNSISDADRYYAEWIFDSLKQVNGG